MATYGRIFYVCRRTNSMTGYTHWSTEKLVTGSKKASAQHVRLFILDDLTRPPPTTAGLTRSMRPFFLLNRPASVRQQENNKSIATDHDTMA